MRILEAENLFKKGLVALIEGNAARATSHFQWAMRIERERGIERPQMRYLSYYGLGLALSRKPSLDAIRACETAARVDFFNPDFHLNLGKVYLLAGKITKALAAFECGLRLAPSHARLQIEMAKVERRGRPAIPWLSRKHVLNKRLGILRASLSSRRTPVRRTPLRRTVSPP